MRFGFLKTLVQKVDSLLTGRGRIDDELFEELEALMIQGDVNVKTTQAVLEDLKVAIREERLANADQVIERLKANLRKVLDGATNEGYALNVATESPTVYLIVGVNGVGKTTSIAKLASLLNSQGKRVVLAAADTFRAAAIDQLEIWAKRTGTEIVKHQDGSDPAAVVYDAINAAKARGADYVIADTAGRLHTRSNLMEELKKIQRVAEKQLGRPVDETLLVLDATTGQNAISQAKQFLNAVNVTGIVLAKLDGTARGGIVITIADELQLPIKLVGLGEKPGDMQPFDPDAFLDGLFA